MTASTDIGFNQAVQDIKAGIAKASSLWVLLREESDRDGFALKPRPWEGPGEYQHVEPVAGGCGHFVRLPDNKHLPKG